MNTSTLNKASWYVGPLVILTAATAGVFPGWLAVPAALVLGLRGGVDLSERGRS